MPNDKIFDRNKSRFSTIWALCTGTQRRNEQDRNADAIGDAGDPIAPVDGVGAAIAVGTVASPTGDSAISIIPSNTVGMTVPMIGSGDNPIMRLGDGKVDFASRPTISAMGKIFGTKWRRKTEDIFDIAMLCTYIEDHYDAKEKRDLIAEHLPIDEPRFRKLQKLGRDVRLMKIEHLLPPSETTLCILSCFSDELLAEAVQSGIVNPGATRATIAAWRTRRQGQRAGDQRAGAPPMVVHMVIRRPADAPQETLDFLDALSRQAAERADVEVEYREYERGMRADDRQAFRWQNRVDAFLRREGQKKLSQIKEKALKNKPSPIIAEEDWQRQQWPHTAAEIAIGPSADQDRVRVVFDRIGRGDDFKSLLDEAYAYARSKCR